eukprot:7185802-Prymnesium_polylepis.1
MALGRGLELTCLPTRLALGLDLPAWRIRQSCVTEDLSRLSVGVRGRIGTGPDTPLWACAQARAGRSRAGFSVRAMSVGVTVRPETAV